MIILLR